jgi:hypothetical protein
MKACRCAGLFVVALHAAGRGNCGELPDGASFIFLFAPKKKALA